MVRHLCCVFINYNRINQLSNTTIWWLDICCLLHRYQLHVLALIAIFRLIGWQQTCKQLYFGMRLMWVEGGWGWMGVRDLVCVEYGGWCRAWVLLCRPRQELSYEFTIFVFTDFSTTCTPNHNQQIPTRFALYGRPVPHIFGGFRGIMDQSVVFCGYVPWSFSNGRERRNAVYQRFVQWKAGPC
jgi:hypothetical protein